MTSPAEPNATNESESDDPVAPQPARNRPREEREQRQRDHILQFLETIHEPGDVVELRALDYHVRADFFATASCYYGDREKLAQDAIVASRRSKGVYVTANTVNAALLARRQEFLWVRRTETTTSDCEIVRRRWLPVDLDPTRPSGIASTAVEHRSALARAIEIRDVLMSEGWPAPILVDSGNGALLLWRVDLQADDGGLLREVLQGLDRRFGTPEVKVDQTMHNPARIIRLPGTKNCKGSPTEDRPHRWSRAIDIPEVVELVPEELLRTAAAEAEAPGAATASGSFDLDEWMARHLSEAEGPSPWHGGRKWVLPTCPWDSSHTNRAAYVLQLASGAIAAGCHHNSCRAKRWHDLRDLIEPGWREASRNRKHDDGNLPVLDNSLLGATRGSKLEPPEPYLPFPLEVLPEPLRSFVRDGASSIGCNESYVALPTLSALASAIGNSRRIRLKVTWTELAILWCAIIGESGSHKSPALDFALKLVRDLQTEKLRDYQKAVEKYERDLVRYQKALAAWKNSRRDDEPPEKPEPPVPERLIISDVTIEACAVLLLNAPRGLLVGRDELSGWVGSFDAFKQGKSDAAHWCELHRGGQLIVDRKTGDHKTIFVPRASVSITGGIQPRILSQALGDEHRENGLLARLLLAMPPRKPRRWTDAEVDPDLVLKMRGVFERLWALTMDRDPEEEPCPIDLPLTPEAKQVFVSFVNEHGLEQVELEGDLAAAWSKLEGYAARLALVIHLVRWAAGDLAASPEAVDAESVEAGVTLARWFCRETRRVYAVLAEDEETRKIRRLAERIVRLGGAVTARDLHRSDRKGYPDSESAEKALIRLVDLGLGHWDEVPPGPRGGRPTRRFVLDSASAADKTPLDPEENEGFGLCPSSDKPEDAPEEEVEWTG